MRRRRRKKRTRYSFVSSGNTTEAIYLQYVGENIDEEEEEEWK
jgi:hypothetical protein